MKDARKLEEYIKHCSDATSLEDIINNYISKHNEEFTTRRVAELISRLTSEHLVPLAKHGEYANALAAERAFYIKQYLVGKTWKTVKEMRENLAPQIDNVNDIIDICNRYHISVSECEKQEAADEKRTRLTEFLKMFPNATLDCDGIPNVCTRIIDNSLACPYAASGRSNSVECYRCKKQFWNEEIK